MLSLLHCIFGLILIEVDGINSNCEGTTQCLSGDDCPKYQEFKKLSRTHPDYQNQRRKWVESICNKKEKRICCPVGYSTFCNDGQEYPANLLPRYGQCGKTCITGSRKRRAIGGVNARLGEFPWAALIGYKVRNRRIDIRTEYRCGGTLINNWYVLTTANCNEGKISSVVLGEWEAGVDIDCLNDSEDPTLCQPPTQVIEVESVTIHDLYSHDKTRVINDIALIRLKLPAVFNNAVQPICLPLNEEQTAEYIGADNLQDGILGRQATVIGWGATENFQIINPDWGVITNILQKVDLTIMSNEYCQSQYNRTDFLQDTHICGGNQTGKGNCNRDGGGGMFIGEEADGDIGTFYQIGIVSFGSRDCVGGFPDVFTRITEFLPWINKIINSTTTTSTPAPTVRPTTGCANEEGCHLPSICDSKPCHPSALCSSISSGFKCLCKEGDVGDPHEAGCLPSSRFPEVVSPTTLGHCGYKPDSFATTHVQCGSSISALNAPWQVSIFQNILGKNWCGGLLISDRHILTAEHCFESGECWRYDNNRCEKGDFRVFFGRTNATIIQPNGVILDDINSAVRRIEEVYVHPMWQYANRLSGGHDIALITVRRLSITPFIKPACLPNPLTHFFLNRNNEKIEFSGFGKNDSDDTTTSNIPHQLQLAQMKIIEKPICDSKLGGDVSPDIFCTIPANAEDEDCGFKPGSCKGDSGGPGVVKDPYGQYVAVGIVSGGPPCGEDEPSLPHYMTSISHHLSFILDHMEEPPCPPPLGAATPPSCNKKFAQLVSDIQCSSKRDCPEGARCLDNFCTSYKDDAQARLARTDCSSPQECLNGAFQCDANIKKCRPDKSSNGLEVHVAGGRGVLSVPSLSSQGILSQTLSSVRSSCWGYKSCAVRTTDERTVCENPICTHSRCWCPYPPSLYLDLSTYKFVDKE